VGGCRGDGSNGMGVITLLLTRHTHNTIVADGKKQEVSEKIVFIHPNPMNNL
jgi:hypothetical protein